MEKTNEKNIKTVGERLVYAWGVVLLVCVVIEIVALALNLLVAHDYLTISSQWPQWFQWLVHEGDGEVFCGVILICGVSAFLRLIWCALKY